MMEDRSDVLHWIRNDDFVEYFLYPVNFKTHDTNEHVLLDNYKNQIAAIVEKYSHNYLWHRDNFKIVAKTISDSLLNENSCNDQMSLPHLYGISHYGDNIDDEWFIVFLLNEISKEIPDLIVRVIDSDGEFLLIEAANYLPKWAVPEMCENRVYLHKGKLHLVPMKLTNGNDDKKISVENAIKILIENSELTQCSAEIQNCINSRIESYPQKISETLHRATVYLPVGVAAILKEVPSLVAPAVLAFCNRDPIDMKVCRAMRYFPPENRVLTSVIFTQHLYAMLTHSKFNPDRRTGWNLPPISSSQYKSHSLGVRLACGFEILLSQAKPPENLENDKGWHLYLTNLKKRNYFRDLLEHSKEYNYLLDRAKEYYKQLKEREHIAPSIGQTILDLNKTLDINIEGFKEEENQLPKEDDDSWLNISPSDLDKMLKDRYNYSDTSQTNSISDTGNLTQKLTEFMNHMSDVDGVEFPNENLKTSSKETTAQLTETKDLKINFDPNGFGCAMQNILDLVIPDDNWDSGSEMSEYDNESENMSLDEKMVIEESSIKRYMDAMDKELASTTIGQSFVKKANESDNFDDIENFQPIDIDRNALKNMLKSYEAQLGEAGPAENLLGPMGIKLEATMEELGLDDD